MSANRFDLFHTTAFGGTPGKEATAVVRAVIYARYSDDKQRAASIEDQVRVCQELISRNGWELGKTYTDAALTGQTTFRPGYRSLLGDARQRCFDVVVAEALDRVSRDQEDTAGLYKRLRFAGVRMVTVAEGEISQLHIGLSGTVNSMFISNLAGHTHRGLLGCVKEGRSAGGISYGYRAVAALRSDGTLLVGQRRIDPDEAAVIIRIFQAYADGKSPKRIALELNADGIRAPRSKKWSASTLNGNRARGTGILNNELYIGRLHWNRLAYLLEPDSGKRRSRQRPAEQHVITEVPELRIVGQELWDCVKQRQASLDQRRKVSDTGSPASSQKPAPFWSKQRPRYLFSGLMRCGVCGGGFSKVSAQHFGCSTARNKGPTACTNIKTIRRDTLERTVLAGLRERMMDPDLFKVFSNAFVAEWNALQGSIAEEQTAREAELRRVRQQIERMVDAIAEGTPAVAVRERLAGLEQRRLALESESATATAPAPRLHPKLPEVYRQQVAELAEALGDEQEGRRARDLIRSLVAEVVLWPADDGQRVEVRGQLAAILALADGPKAREAGKTAVLAEQIKVVAGAGFEPAAFRL